MNAVVESISGDRLRELFAVAAAHLEELAPAVNAINVYPVPDGDTGSNMSATLREAVRIAGDLPPGAPVGEVAAAIARGGLYGARGNSGVILSQALRGFAAALAARESLDGPAFAAALTAAADSAYSAVAEPREGTMLTVLRAAAQGAGSTPTPAALADVLSSAVGAAEEAEARTIDQLPQLREAGVTDSGGEGVCVILRGLHAALTGATVPPVANIAAAPANLHSLLEETYGHCTEFLLEQGTTPLDVDAIREWLSSGDNQSVVVVGDAGLARVHVHTLEPESLIAACSRFGDVRRVKVDDIDLQATQFAAGGSGATAKVAVLALSPGQGFDAVFRDLGVHVLRLGEITKPSAGEIAAAAEAIRVPDIVVLPNHENVLLAAQQAVALTSCSLHVVPSVTLPQGVAAAFAFDATAPLDVTTVTLAAAIATVRTVEVTRATASRTAEGIAVREGDWLALLDTRLVTTAVDSVSALIAGLRATAIDEPELITVYRGEGPDTEDASLLDALAESFPGSEVQILAGGQPLYVFIASIE